MPAFRDLSRLPFGRLVVLERGPNAPCGRTRWLCECVCGTKKLILSGHLTCGITQSCGCLLSESSRQRRSTHNLSYSSEYIVYKHIKSRCTNPKDASYKNYGGRGIVCAWTSFEEFYVDMGPCPSPELTIERKNNDGPYSKANCIWTTRLEQNRNKRSNRYLEFHGECLPLREVVRLSGLRKESIRYRLAHGIPLERASRQGGGRDTLRAR